MNICIVGLGFVGLSMATVVASKGFKVIGIENDNEKCKLINQKKIPFFEPQVEDLLKDTLGKSFQVTTDLEEAVTKSDIIFICVGTPSQPDGSVDLTYIEKACQAIGTLLKKENSFKIIVIKSTVPPMTTSKLVKNTLEKFSSKKSETDFGLCMNPEFLKEGTAVEDMLNPHLVVIGASDEKTKKILHEFYEKLYTQKTPPMLDTTTTNAELIKYVNNSFLATKISFINTIANICNQIEGADVEVIAKAIGYDPRIGPLFLKAGPGFGGSCFPKDVSGFLNFSKSIGYRPLLLESTNKVNQNQPYIILEMIKKQLKNFEGKTLSILGLSFKKNTDDIRESVSTKIVKSLLENKGVIKVHDPMAIPNFRKVFRDKITYCESPKECISGSDCCVILTDWDEYGSLSAEDFKNNMNFPCVIDARRMLDPKKMLSIDYTAIGYGKKNS